MREKFLELRINRDFGDILTTYFEFLKQNIKKFTNVFLSYNGVFLVGLLITSYLLVSGFVGMIAAESNVYGVNSGGNIDDGYWVNLVIGFVLFFVIFLLAIALNFSLTTSYIIKYEKSGGKEFDKGKVWEHTKSNLLKTILFILLLIPFYLVLLVLMLLVSFIPFLGSFIQLTVTAWIGVSYVNMLEEKKGVFDALKEGWSLVSNNFWKSIGANFILGFLNFLLIFLCTMGPMIILSFVTFHVIDSNVEVISSITLRLIYTIGVCLLLVISVYAQCLSQFVNGILYYALHEKTYNLNTRSKIEQIGQPEE